MCLLLTACTGPRTITEGPSYPQEVPLGPTLDIQVFRRDTHIELTNTTAQALGPASPAVLWLNRWYARPIDDLAPGQSLRLPLREFKDRYGESFRAGGFFAIQRPDTLATCELHTADPSGNPVILPLVVVEGQ
jgi:hypothetical protein